MDNLIADPELQGRVEAALDTIRPYLEADGGNLRLLGITTEMVVVVELLGSCGSCPMSAMTMKAGIEQAVKSAIPAIKSVYAINLTPMQEPDDFFALK
jgi:Fe-S cluster biogenesis protein NfuA